MEEAFGSVLVQVLLIALITLLIVRWSLVGPIAKAAQWMKTLRTGERATCLPARSRPRPAAPTGAGKCRPSLRALMAARSAAEVEVTKASARNC